MRQTEVIQAAIKETVQLLEGFLLGQHCIKTRVLPDHSSSLPVCYSFVLSEEHK